MENLQTRKDILYDKKEKSTTKNTLPGKAFVQILWGDKKFCRQRKAKRLQHHQFSFTRNVKGTSLGEKEKTTARNMKIMKTKILLVKETYSKGSKSTTYKATGRIKDKN